MRIICISLKLNRPFNHSRIAWSLAMPSNVRLSIKCRQKSVNNRYTVQSILEPYQLPAAANSSFPFFDLPFDVRRLIYLFLVPNTRSRESFGRPFRDDGPCYPAILRVSKMICQEVHREWYSSVFYGVGIHSGGIKFLDHHRHAGKLVESPFKSVSSLCMAIRLEWRPARQESLRDRINECFQHHKTFRRVHLHLRIPHPSFRGLNIDPPQLTEVLEATLSLIRSIQGLSEAFLDVHMELPSQSKASEKLSRSCDEFGEVAKQYFSNFESSFFNCSEILVSKSRAAGAG